MKVKTQLNLGGVQYTFEIEERDEMDTLHKAAVLSSPRAKCNVCEDAGLSNKKLTSNKDSEGNTYVNVVCLKCGAKSKLGQFKTGGYFWREYEKYEPKAK